jgi:hypothetical protein
VLSEILNESKQAAEIGRGIMSFKIVETTSQVADFTLQGLDGRVHFFFCWQRSNLAFMGVGQDTSSHES